MHGSGLIHSVAVMGLHQCRCGNLQYSLFYPEPTSVAMIAPSSECENTVSGLWSVPFTFIRSSFLIRWRTHLYSCPTCFWIGKQRSDSSSQMGCCCTDSLTRAIAKCNAGWVAVRPKPVTVGKFNQYGSKRRIGQSFPFKPLKWGCYKDQCVQILVLKMSHDTQGYSFKYRSNQKRSDVHSTMTMLKYQILTQPLILTTVWFVSLSAPVHLCPCERNGAAAKGGNGKNGR